MPDLSRLSALAVDPTPLRAVLRSRTDFLDSRSRLLAFDQSFSATGWALLEFTSEQVIVRQAGTIKTASTLTGAREDLHRAEQVEDEVDVLMQIIAFNDVAVEMPLKGGQIRNPEVSLMAAQAIRSVARRHGYNPHIVPPKTWKKMATANANLKDKRIAHRAVAGWPWVVDFALATNESQRDAVMVGLGAMWRDA